MSIFSNMPLMAYVDWNRDMAEKIAKRDVPDAKRITYTAEELIMQALMENDATPRDSTLVEAQ